MTQIPSATPAVAVWNPWNGGIYFGGYRACRIWTCARGSRRSTGLDDDFGDKHLSQTANTSTQTNTGFRKLGNAIGQTLEPLKAAMHTRFRPHAVEGAIGKIRRGQILTGGSTITDGLLNAS